MKGLPGILCGAAERADSEGVIKKKAAEVTTHSVNQPQQVMVSSPHICSVLFSASHDSGSHDIGSGKASTWPPATYSSLPTTVCKHT